MIIPKNTQEYWQSLRDHGDIMAIKKKSNLSYMTIWKAFETKIASGKTISEINKFYRLKKKQTS